MYALQRFDIVARGIDINTTGRIFRKFAPIEQKVRSPSRKTTYLQFHEFRVTERNYQLCRYQPGLSFTTALTQAARCPLKRTPVESCSPTIDAKRPHLNSELGRSCARSYDYERVTQRPILIAARYCSQRRYFSRRYLPRDLQWR